VRKPQIFKTTLTSWELKKKKTLGLLLEHLVAFSDDFIYFFEIENMWLIIPNLRK